MESLLYVIVFILIVGGILKSLPRRRPGRRSMSRQSRQEMEQLLGELRPLERGVLQLLIKEAESQSFYPIGDATAMMRLVEAAKRAAEELSNSKAALVSLPFIGATHMGPVHLEVNVTEEEARKHY